MNETGLTTPHIDITSAMTAIAIDWSLTKVTSSPSTALHKYSDGFRYTCITLMIVILIVIMVANITLMSVICFHKKLQTTTNIFIANLALGDTIMAFAVLPFDIDRLLRGYFAFNEKICDVSNTIFFLSLPASALNLSILTLERFCAIRFPLMHRTGRIFTAKRKCIILFCSWLYISVTACLPIMGWRNYQTAVVNGQCLFDFKVEYALFQLCVNFILPLVFIVIMNFWILKIASKGLPSRNLSRKYSSGPQILLRKNSGISKHKQAKRRMSSQGSVTSPDANKKAAKIIAILVGVFAFCWLPYIINIAVNISCKGCSPQEVTLSTMILVFFNSATNPILYGILKPQIRSSLREVTAKITNTVCRNRNRERANSHFVDKEIELTCI